MAKNTLQKKFKHLLTPRNILVSLFGTLSLIVVIVLLVRSGRSSQTSITENQIRMEKNGEIITINDNGLVEYRTKDTVTYKIWDSGKVNRFFDVVRNKARDYLENPNQTGDCVYVSLYLDGELVTICFSEDDEVVQEAYEEFDEDDDTTELTDLFDDDGDDGDDGGDGDGDDLSDYFDVTPTPTTVATPTPGGSGDTGDPELPPPLPIEASCESWEEQIVGGRAIISNTLCSISPEE